MATIELNIKRMNGPVVVAYDPGGGAASRKGGDIETQPGDVIAWQCANESQSFLVRFYRFDTSADIWPFSQPPDKTGPGPNPVQYLRVNSKNAKTVNVTSPVTIKYEVEDESGSAEPLDPMIIIRPQAPATLNVAFGVSCAVLGAVAGALVAAWLS
jgi:hypothetical protein